MGFLKVSVPKLSPFTSKLRQRQKNKSLQSLATLVNFLAAGVRLELTTFGLWCILYIEGKENDIKFEENKEYGIELLKKSAEQGYEEAIKKLKEISNI